MAFLVFDYGDDKEMGKRWKPLEENFPGARDLLHHVCAILTMTHHSMGVRRVKKHNGKKGQTVFKYHVCTYNSSKNDAKICTIYINSKKQDYTIKLFEKDKKMYEIDSINFNSLEELQELIMNHITKL